MSEQNSHLVCPHCSVTNRVPAARLNAAPNCGKCGQPLLTASPHELNAQTVNKVIQKNEVLTIVDFWASWCQPGLMMAPQFKAAASQLPQVVFAKIQTDKYEQAAAPYNIRSYRRWWPLKMVKKSRASLEHYRAIKSCSG